MKVSVEQARQYYATAEAVHDFDHVLRVLALAERIGGAEGADMEVVRAAVLLHDTHRAVEDTQGGDHAAMAADHARRVLVGAAPDFVEAVAHAIRAHRFRNDTAPQTLEAQAVFDADKLDAIGAVGVARAFSYGGHNGQRLWADEVPSNYDGRILTEAHTPHHEFVYKLAKIKDRLYTPTGRAIAQARHRFMAAFYARMADEVAGRA